ncbi:MAG TPA: DUF4440 domain-containing protein [Gemmatimonadaceae bacterium]|nr:DUF4440 domain-containing protein [Gemmatimonadaceae bacterium]
MKAWHLILLTALIVGCAPAPQAQVPDAEVETTLVAHAHRWVDTWNNNDVERMSRLHAADVSLQLYGIGDAFVTMDELLEELREENFWKLSWSINMVEPRVRRLGAEAALVAFRLVGKETRSDGSSRPYAAAYSLVFQRDRHNWKIVHVHSSSGRAPGQH